MAYQQHLAVLGPRLGSGGFQYMNSLSGNTAFTKVFVGGLAWETQSENMKQYFEQFGEILEAVVITDKHTGRSKGYGFVTFRDPESARRACEDLTPIIDGRRANCNLASLGKPQPEVPCGRLRNLEPYCGGSPSAGGAYIGNFGYQQPVTYGFQQGLVYSLYGYAAYSPEYTYSQGVYNSFGSQQFLQIHGLPGTVNTTVYPYSQFTQTVPGSPNYTTSPGYVMPGNQIVQLGGPTVNTLTTSVPIITTPYSTGKSGANVLVVPGIATPIPPQPPQRQFILPVHFPQFMQGNGSDQNVG